MAVAESLCIIGAKGMLGRELVRLCSEGPSAISAKMHALDIEEIDISAPKSVSEVFGRLCPRVVINAAAYTDVDGCESHEDRAMSVNAEGPANLARACRESGARLVHVSTDYVFDGSKTSPWLPDDPVRPINVYGRSKAAGDENVRRLLPNHVIVRTSWLFGVQGKNFVRTILQLSMNREEVTVVTDQVGRPTFAADLAEALLRMAAADCTGTYHFANAGVCSWNELACEIVRLSGRRCRVLPMLTSQLERPAARPAYSVLDTGRIERELGIRPRHWKEALADCMGVIEQSIPA